MKALAMFFMFLGILLVVHNIYEEKYEKLKKNVRIEYRFIPRTYYEEQITANPEIAARFKNMFEKDSWIDRNVTVSNPGSKT